jgi:hypothetical protein
MVQGCRSVVIGAASAAIAAIAAVIIGAEAAATGFIPNGVKFSAAAVDI